MFGPWRNTLIFTSSSLIFARGTSRLRLVWFHALDPGNHAPEMLELANKEEYTLQVDVYSYAILLYRIITRLIPFIGYDLGAKINAAVIAGERPQWKHVPVATFGFPTLTELMLWCWSGKPTKRPTTAKITEQVCHLTFQCLIAKQLIPSVCASCLSRARFPWSVVSLWWPHRQPNFCLRWSHTQHEVFFLNWNLSRAASLVSDPVHAYYGTFRFNRCPWRVCLGQRLLHLEWVALQVRGIHEIRPTS